MQTILHWKGPTSTNTQHSIETDTDPHHRTSLWIAGTGDKAELQQVSNEKVQTKEDSDWLRTSKQQGTRRKKLCLQSSEEKYF